MSIGIIGSADGPTAVFLASPIYWLERILFSVLLALLVLHEMDAIRAKEWRMFAVLKDMPEQRACNVFLLLHLPLCAAVFFFLGWGPGAFLVKLVIDAFLLCHAVLHFAFRGHPHNGFCSQYSKALIVILSVLALAHTCLLAAMLLL